MLRFSSSTACTASASGLAPSASSRIDSVILGQFLPPSKGVPLSMSSAAFLSKRWMALIAGVSTAPGKPGGIMDQAGTARPCATFTTLSRSMACATARRTLRLSKGGFVTCGSRYQVPGNG